MGRFIARSIGTQLPSAQSVFLDNSSLLGCCVSISIGVSNDRHASIFREKKNHKIISCIGIDIIDTSLPLKAATNFKEYKIYYDNWE